MKFEFDKYLITENENCWHVARSLDNVRVEYKVSKELADTPEALKRYIADHPELF